LYTSVVISSRWRDIRLEGAALGQIE
jgi:hypothetical protein